MNETIQQEPTYLRKTLFQRPDRVHDPLYVITPIFNPVRWRTRWKLYEDFAKHCEEAGAILYTVEPAFGNRDHAITDPSHPRHIQVRTETELWFKENLINVGVSRLPSDWKYVAWVDADTIFARWDWANETLHQLQHYAFVQMWSQIHDLNSSFEIAWSNYSFMHCYLQNDSKPVDPVPPPAKVNGHGTQYLGMRPSSGPLPQKPPRGRMGSPGLAWACTRRAWDTVGGMLDTCILGSADMYMANGLVGRCAQVFAEQQKRQKFHPGYVRRVMEWQERAKNLHRNIGMVPGATLHCWHGPRGDRGYETRNNILFSNQFNPDTHLRRDWQGMWQLDEKQVAIREEVRKYFRARNEDQP